MSTSTEPIGPGDIQLFTSLRYDPLLLDAPENIRAWPPELLQNPNNLKVPFYLLPYHRDRLLEAAAAFGWTVAKFKISGVAGFIHLFNLLYRTIKQTIETSPLFIKIVLSRNGEIGISKRPIPEVKDATTLFPKRLPPPTHIQELRTANLISKISPSTGGALTLAPDAALPGDPPIPSSPYTIYIDTKRTERTPYTAHKTTERTIYNEARERFGITDPKQREEVLLINEDGEVMEGSLTNVYFWLGGVDGGWVTPAKECGGLEGVGRRWALEKGLCVEGFITTEVLAEGDDCWISNGVRGFQLGKITLKNRG